MVPSGPDKTEKGSYGPELLGDWHQNMQNLDPVGDGESAGGALYWLCHLEESFCFQGDPGTKGPRPGKGW